VHERDARVATSSTLFHYQCAKCWCFSRSAGNHPFTMRESPYVKSLPYHLPPVLTLAVVLAVTGPFGTYEHMGLGVRLAYFVCLSVLNWLQVVFLAAWLGTREPIDRWPVAARMTLVGSLASLPGTIEIMVIHAWLVRPIPLVGLPIVFLENTFLTVVIAVVIGLLVEQRLRAAADAERDRVASLPQPSAPDFFRRIPPALGRDLLALEMEDHYLRIHTALGSDLILMRLRDAVSELGPTRGQQVHRSWWVADGAVASTERTAQRLTLVLRNGLRAPVSKSFRGGVRNAGWLDA
jgi:DNA-binding LytR/AlgR family response regulator